MHLSFFHSPFFFHRRRDYDGNIQKKKLKIRLKAADIQSRLENFNVHYLPLITALKSIHYYMYIYIEKCYAISFNYTLALLSHCHAIISTCLTLGTQFHEYRFSHLLTRRLKEKKQTAHRSHIVDMNICVIFVQNICNLSNGIESVSPEKCRQQAIFFFFFSIVCSSICSFIGLK